LGGGCGSSQIRDDLLEHRLRIDGADGVEVPASCRSRATLPGRDRISPEVAEGCRKLTLAGSAIAPKVSFPARPRTHSLGQEPPLATGSFVESPLPTNQALEPQGGHPEMGTQWQAAVGAIETRRAA